MASWYLAPSLVKLRQQINSAYQGRDRSTDGAIGDAAHNARKSDHNADWDSSPPGMVRAIDIDKDLLGGVTDPSVMQGLVNKLIQDPRTAYVIYRSRIWQNPAVYRNGGWRSTSANRSAPPTRITRTRTCPSDTTSQPSGLPPTGHSMVTPTPPRRTS